MKISDVDNLMRQFKSEMSKHSEVFNFGYSQALLDVREMLVREYEDWKKLQGGSNA